MRTPLVAWLVFVVAACGAPPDEGDLRLPVSTQGEPAQSTDFVLTLRHVPPSHIECADSACTIRSHWIVDASSRLRGSTLADGMRFEMGSPSSLSTLLRRDAERTPPGPGLTHEASVSIRAAADASMDLVLALLRSVAVAHVYRVEFAVLAASVPRELHRLPTPLPVDEEMNGRSPARLAARARVVVGAAQAGSEQYRVSITEEPVGIQLLDVDKPTESPSESRTVTGLTALRELLAAWSFEQRTGKRTEAVEGIVEADRTTLQAAVDVIDAFRAAGVDGIQFALPTGSKRVPPIR